MEDRFVGEAATLATTTSRSLGQIAKYLKGQDTSKQLRNFYRHLNVHCMFINDHVTRIRSALGPDHDLIVQVLQLFESLISPSLSKTTLSMGLEAYPRQTCLNQHWNDIRDADENAKLTFAQNCLVIGESMDSGVQRDFDDAFYLWEEDAVSRYPDDGGQLSVDERPPPKKSRSEPPYAIWSAAQSLFKALTGSTRCLCHPDELDARLCLATHRKSALSDSVDDGDFDIFLSMETFLQEAHVVTVRDTIVRIVEPHQTLLPPRKTDYKPMPIKKLCEQIHKMQKNKSQRLELKVEKGRLLKLRSEKSNFQIDRSKPPVSLQQLITQGSRHLTEKTKRILAVLMSYAVLHLHGTPWLQPSWDSSHILFFQTAALRIPLRPFIRTELSSSGDEGHDVCSSLREKLQVRDIDEIDPDDLDPDDFDPDDFDPEDLDPDDFEHPFPSLVTLAVILMELYLATPFKTLASDRNIDIQDDTGSLKRSLDVASIFEECKHEIPQNSQFYYAIQKCLDPRTWEDENTGQRLDDDALRVRMYQEVIRPLEDELCDGFNFITIEELDKIAESIDIASWGQMIQDQPDDASTGTVSPPPLFDGALPSRFQSLVSSSVPFQHPVMVPWNWNPSAMPGPFFSGLGSPPPIESEYTVARFYDDEKPSESHSQEEYDMFSRPTISNVLTAICRLKKYLSWKKKYLDVYEKYIDPHIQSSSQHPVKIAILDSGVDETHCQVDTDNVKIKRNWTNKKFVKAVHDSDGHGTFVASLIVDFAPDAELYISKIADKDPSSPETIAEV